MSTTISRRTALQLALAAGTAPAAWQTAIARGETLGTVASPKEAEGLTSYQHGGQVAIRWNNFVIATYRASPVQKYPYFSHLAGPITGLPLTTESSLPFPHHRGLWIGCDPLNGGDYWTDAELDKGQIRSMDLHVGETTANSVEILDRCQWIRRGAASPLLDERKITFRLPNERLRLIDFDVKLSALQDIVVTKAKHSFFALRVAPDLSPLGGGSLENSAGDSGESATFGKPADWCGYAGKRTAHGIVEGIAVMNHPDNPWKDCPWFTRDYGHLSPSPFNFLNRPWTFGEGQSIRVRYRVVLHAGTPAEARLDRVYKEWLTG